MSKRTFVFGAPVARRISDPVFYKSHRMERHVFMVPVRSVPAGLPLDPDARLPNIRKRVYREVEESLLDIGCEEGTFHLKHKGITLIAQSVDQKGQDQYVVILEGGHGILDGGHTYELIEKHLDENDLPEKQFVKFEILTNVPPDWIPDIARGLNTSVQVQDMSLDHLAGKFDWIKKELKGQPYFTKIAWREGEDGVIDARDIISLMTCFNIELYPNDKDEQPVMAYEKKSSALKKFEEESKKPSDSYKRLRTILKDILVLHDTIRRDFREKWNIGGGKAGHFKFVESRKRGVFEFPFTGKRGGYRLTNGALYPMLAAFRWMVEENPDTGHFRWKDGFGEVLIRWDVMAEELMRMTAQVNDELGRNPNAIGKSRSHWANLHTRLAMRELMQQAKAAS